MSSTNYLVIITPDDTGSRLNTIGRIVKANKKTTSFQISMMDNQSTVVDAESASVVVFGI